MSTPKGQSRNVLSAQNGVNLPDLRTDGCISYATTDSFLGFKVAEVDCDYEDIEDIGCDILYVLGIVNELKF